MLPPIPLWVLDWAQIAAHVVTVLGLPAAIYSYWRQSSRQQRDREHGTYSSLDDKYFDFLKLCIDHPALGMLRPAAERRKPYDPLELVQRNAMFEILLSIFERAFLMMHDDHRSKARSRQWTGWEEYLKAWIENPEFAEFWSALGKGFDADFIRYVDRLMSKQRPAA